MVCTWYVTTGALSWRARSTDHSTSLFSFYALSVFSAIMHNRKQYPLECVPVKATKPGSSNTVKILIFW